jgi:DNA-binding PadR family transcriptional regulator
MTTREAELTSADLVVLSLLIEQPMHGYELNRELVRRDVRDWAGVSRPQVYYSLRKLAAAGHIGPAAGDVGATGDVGGPERHVYRVTRAGHRAFAAALARPEWTTQRPPPPFLTWLVLATHASPAVVQRQIDRRREFLEAEAARERRTLAAIRADTGPTVAVAALIVDFTIRQFEAELAWLREVDTVLAADRSAVE